jgi:hypothetical protein
MRTPVAITPPRDCIPAQRCLLLAVISTIFLGLPGAADARGKGKPPPVNPPAVTTAVVPARATTMATTIAAAAPASLRAANDSVAPKATVEMTTGSLRGGATVGKASAAATAAAVPDTLPSATVQRPKDWYPENHSYLRPYHYKWRYWTPG